MCSSDLCPETIIGMELSKEFFSLLFSYEKKGQASNFLKLHSNDLVSMPLNVSKEINADFDFSKASFDATFKKYSPEVLTKLAESGLFEPKSFETQLIELNHALLPSMIKSGHFAYIQDCIKQGLLNEKLIHNFYYLDLSSKPNLKSIFDAYSTEGLKQLLASHMYMVDNIKSNIVPELYEQSLPQILEAFNEKELDFIKEHKLLPVNLLKSKLYALENFNLEALAHGLDDYKIKFLLEYKVISKDELNLFFWNQIKRSHLSELPKSFKQDLLKAFANLSKGLLPADLNAFIDCLKGSKGNSAWENYKMQHVPQMLNDFKLF